MYMCKAVCRLLNKNPHHRTITERTSESHASGHTADMYVVRHNRHDCCCDTADTCAVSHSKRVCCVTQADMSGVRHSRHGFCVTQ